MLKVINAAPVRSEGRQLASVLPQSSLLVIPGAGHIAFEETPEVCNRAMSDWLAGVLPAAGNTA
jgi:pimeloyl-ACP methyl ester carboxylesterase